MNGNVMKEVCMIIINSSPTGENKRRTQSTRGIKSYD